MKPQVIQSFKGVSSLELQASCSAIHISHKYCVGVLILSNQVHLISTDDLLQGNESRAVATGIIAQKVICTEDKLAAAFQAVVSIYSFNNLNQPIGIGTLNAITQIRCMSFNPTDSNMLAVLTERGNLIVGHSTPEGLHTQSFNDSNITAICFSPKGKQLCVGHSDGTMSQLKLDLTLAKRIPARTGIPLSILWVSTTQFLVSFLVNGDQLELVQIDLQKAPALPLYHVIGDPFVSDAATPMSQTFMTVLHPNAIICSASTSADVVVLSKTGDKWDVELGEDDRKADLPLDHYSVGQAFYFNATEPVIVDGIQHNPMPVYVIASQHGVVRSFSVINSQEKGEGQKFSAGLTPLNLSLFSLPPPVTAPAVTAALPTMPLPSFTFDFKRQVPQPVKTDTLTISHPLLDIFSTPVKPKEETVTQVEDAKKNLKPDIDKQEKKVIKNELSPAVVFQFQEFQKRFIKFQADRAECMVKFEKDVNILKDGLDMNVKDLRQSEDFIHDLEKTCAVQQKEINNLREKAISDLAQMEYVKGIEKQNKDPNYLQLLRARPLDLSTLKELKGIERTFKAIQRQIQECRKSYFYQGSPGVEAPPININQIHKTLEIHGKVIQILINKNNAIREKLGLAGSLEKLTEQLKASFISDDLKPIVPAVKLNAMKDFLRQRNIIRLKTTRPKPSVSEIRDDKEHVNVIKSQPTDLPVSTVPVKPVPSGIGLTAPAPATTASATFGQATTSTPAFIAKTTTVTTSTFGQFATSVRTFGALTTTSSTFGQAITGIPAITTTASTTFGQGVAGIPTHGAISTTASITFGLGVPGIPAFMTKSTAATTSTFGQLATSVSPFGVLTTTPSTFGQAIFTGIPAITTTAPTTTFGLGVAGNAGIPTYGAITATASTTFGPGVTGIPAFIAKTTTATTSTTFGQLATSVPTFRPLTTTPSTFGQPMTGIPAFGAITTTASSTFELGATGIPAFIAKTTTATTSTFGQLATSVPTFGAPTNTTPSTFGQAITGIPATTTTASTTLEMGTTSIPAFIAKPTTATTSTIGQLATTVRTFGALTTTPSTLGQAITGIPAITTTASTVELGATGVPAFIPKTTTATTTTFGQLATSVSTFGSLTTTPSTFGQANTGILAFGAKTTTATTTTFGQGINTSPVFGAIPTTAFGQATTTSTLSLTSGSMTTTPSKVEVTTSSPAIAALTTTSPEIEQVMNSFSAFGAIGTTGPKFGQATAPAFGASTTTAPTFGQGSFTFTPTSSSLFGGGGTTVVPSTATPAMSSFSFTSQKPLTGSAFGSTSSSVFGGSATFGTTQASAFGGSAVFGSGPLTSFAASPTASGPIFGGGGQAAVGFGQLAQQSASAGGFGGGNVFGGTSTFGASVSSPSSGSIFGGNSQFGQTMNTSGSTFGGGDGGNVFGGNTSFGSPSGSIFGGNTQTPQQVSPFGSAAPTGASGSVFGGPSTFGSPSTFGQVSPQGGSIFGGAGTTTFGSTGGSPFGGGTSSFSSFASPQPQQQQQQTSPSFGGNSFSSWR